MSLLALVALLSVTAVSAAVPANADFQRTWERTDKPVKDLTVSRTWMWGPSANTPAMDEDYVDSPGNMRTVQYFDKSRMEINDPDAPRDVWYVTNGLLVVELITGQMQIGDDTFVSRWPANIPVAGDADDTSGPTYAALAKVADAMPLLEGAEITWRIDRDGNVSSDIPLTGHGVTAAHFDAVTNHTVASPFWAFMNSSGTVWENGANTTGKLFQDPLYVTGRPITEAYWATVKVAGTEQDVLLQCFERRCLTYTPRNADGWKVEAGNVGQHYFNWRYGNAQATIYLVALEDDGASGIPVGCGDSLIAIQRPVEDTMDPVTAALTELFSIKTRDFGESGLITALYQSDLTVDNVTITAGHATVAISGTLTSGGTCDDPRITEQIRQTVLTAPGVTTATITINGTPIDDIFDLQG